MMAIAFTCRECGQKYQVHPALAGKPVGCRACHAVMTVPADKPKPTLQTFGSMPTPVKKTKPASPPRDFDDDTIYSADELEFHDEPIHASTRSRPGKPPISGFDIDPTLPNPGRAGYVERDEEPPLIPSGMFLRWMAFLIDRVLILVISGLVAWFLVPATGVLERPGGIRKAAELTWLTFAVVWLLYLSVIPATPMEGTPGKWLCGLKVVMFDGDRIGLHTALSRGLYQFGIEMFPIVLMWNIYHALSDPDEMTRYDQFCRTRVIRYR